MTTNVYVRSEYESATDKHVNRKNMGIEKVECVYYRAMLPKEQDIIKY